MRKVEPADIQPSVDEVSHRLDVPALRTASRGQRARCASRGGRARRQVSHRRPHCAEDLGLLLVAHCSAGAAASASSVSWGWVRDAARSCGVRAHAHDLLAVQRSIRRGAASIVLWHRTSSCVCRRRRPVFASASSRRYLNRALGNRKVTRADTPNQTSITFLKSLGAEHLSTG